MISELGLKPRQPSPDLESPPHLSQAPCAFFDTSVLKASIWPRIPHLGHSVCSTGSWWDTLSSPVPPLLFCTTGSLGVVGLRRWSNIFMANLHKNLYKDSSYLLWALRGGQASPHSWCSIIRLEDLWGETSIFSLLPLALWAHLIRKNIFLAR